MMRRKTVWRQGQRLLLGMVMAAGLAGCDQPWGEAPCDTEPMVTCCNGGEQGTPQCSDGRWRCGGGFIEASQGACLQEPGVALRRVDGEGY